MRYFSMFSGIGGFELGIQQAYGLLQNLPDPKEHEHEAADSTGVGQGGVDADGKEGLVCIGYSEIDKYAIQIYSKHYPEHKNYGERNQN